GCRLPPVSATASSTSRRRPPSLTRSAPTTVSTSRWWNPVRPRTTTTRPCPASPPACSTSCRPAAPRATAWSLLPKPPWNRPRYRSTTWSQEATPSVSTSNNETTAPYFPSTQRPTCPRDPDTHLDARRLLRLRESHSQESVPPQ